MIPKLTDFSKEELNWIRRLAELECAVLDEFCGNYEAGEYLKVGSAREAYSQKSLNRDYAHQWLTKLTEAIQEVERNERIQSN
jgi:hypothetical protein